GGEMEIEELRGQLEPAGRGLVAVHHEVASEHALAGPADAGGRLARERPPDRRAEQMREGQEMGAAARAADLGRQPPRPGRVEPGAGECGDATDRIAAALARGRGRRLEGDAPLLRDDVL